MDKYDEQIEFLTENPDLIRHHWNISHGLFDMCAADEIGDSGCLTMIRSERCYVAQTTELTEEIRADKRIPTSPDDITIECLPVFAEWQRKLDQMPFRQKEVAK